MNINEIFESVTSVVYHYTSVFNAASILANGHFRLSTSAGTDTEAGFGKKLYYLSTARTKHADYTVSSAYQHGVVFVLNGDWFNQRYSGSPVDYWGPSWKGKHRKEAEDRIFSEQPYIDLPEDYTKVIKAIHVLDKSPEKSDQLSKAMRVLLIQAKQHDVPIYVYDDISPFLNQNTSRAIPLTTEYIQSLKTPPVKSVHRSSRDYFAAWRELYFKSPGDELSKDARRIMNNYLFTGYRMDDAVRTLSADIHNEKSRANPGLVKLLDIFQKLKIKTAKEYVNYLANKWYPDNSH